MNKKIATGFESGIYTCMTLINLQILINWLKSNWIKAFDTISHDILIKKMVFKWFSDEVTKWLKSYLSNRKFKVKIKYNFSESGNLLETCLLYINDQPLAVVCELLLHTDDTCLIVKQKDIPEIETKLNKNLTMLCDWFLGNKLSIHFGEDKTKSICLAANIKLKTQNH